jgi:hypothetical protein
VRASAAVLVLVCSSGIFWAMLFFLVTSHGEGGRDLRSLLSGRRRSDGGEEDRGSVLSRESGSGVGVVGMRGSGEGLHVEVRIQQLHCRDDASLTTRGRGGEDLATAFTVRTGSNGCTAGTKPR